MIKNIIIFLVLACIMGCSSVTLRQDQEPRNEKPATYQKTYNYWWWGLKGEHDINVREICQGNGVDQMQAINTFTNTLSIIFTLGIYSPRTARVWCKE